MLTLSDKLQLEYIVWFDILGKPWIDKISNLF